MRIDLERGLMEVGVRDLVPEDENPFTPGFGWRARLQAGTRVHTEVQTDRAAEDDSYRREVHLRGQLEVDGLEVRIDGRADGLWRSDDGILIEEIKSVMAAAETLREARAEHYPAYALQLRLYMWLAERSEGLPVRGRLLLVSLATGSRHIIELNYRRGEVEALIVTRVRFLVEEARARQAWLERRRCAAGELGFPHPSYRLGQDALELAATEAFEAREALVASAPTGLGKTAAVLTAALKVGLASDRQVVWLTSRTTQQRIVAETFQRLAGTTKGLSAVVLTAKEKICLNDVVHCHPDACEFAREYPAKVHATGVLAGLASRGLADAEVLTAEARRVRACPFEMGLDLVDRADLVVGDSNYVFDPRVGLMHLQGTEARGWLLVVDEAHALVDRVRAAYSPRLEGSALELMDAHLESTEGGERLRESVGDLQELLHRASLEASDPVEAGDAPPLWAAPRYRKELEQLCTRLEERVFAYLMGRGPRDPGAPRDPVVDFYYGVRHLAQVMGIDDEAFVSVWQEGAAGGAYGLLCLDPSRLIERRLRAFAGSVAMSGTLTPLEDWRQALGLEAERTRTQELPSPFPPTRRRIVVAPGIATTWKQRARFHPQVAELVRQVVQSRPGHYVAFFPSFAYLRAVAGRLDLGDVEILEQTTRMDEHARTTLFERLRKTDGSSRLLLAVLGGIFAEGVDFPGESLIGAVVVSPALPTVSPERELIRQYFDRREGRGFETAYVAPGMTRVVQAVGRLIRSESDAGVAVLVGRRFRQATYSRYFPNDWSLSGADRLAAPDLESELERFWLGLGSDEAPPTPD